MSLGIIRGGGDRRSGDGARRWSPDALVGDPDQTSMNVIEAKSKTKKESPLEKELTRQGAVVFQPTPYGFR